MAGHAIVVVKDINLLFYHGGGGGGGGYSVRTLMGVCRWPLKIGPNKIEGNMKFGT